jgi:glycosyltransferase involved in cell wall biosynthesis
MRICVVATNGLSLMNFRGELIKSLVLLGHDVTCISIEPKKYMMNQVADLGAEYFQVGGTRVGIGLFSGIKMITAYIRAFRKLKPDMCFLYMSKPVAFGGFAAVKCKVRHINILVNGLENAYYRHGLKDWLVRCVMSFFYNYVGKYSDNIFMQNSDDYNYFMQHRITKKEKTIVINGSGVNMNYFEKKPLPNNPVFLMISRLLWSKGIREYLDAMKIIKQDYPEVRFLLVGGLDHNDESLSKEELDKYVSVYGVEYCGCVSDVRPFLEQCSIFVLPSYHEGTPRSVLEAMAIGRAIITTRAPGCRETVIDGENGFLVDVGNVEMLADRMRKLIRNDELREKMAESSYNLCLGKYEIGIINNMIINNMINRFI